MSSCDSCRSGDACFVASAYSSSRFPDGGAARISHPAENPFISRPRTSLPTRSQIYHRPLAVCASTRPGAFGVEVSAKSLHRTHCSPLPSDQAAYALNLTSRFAKSTVPGAQTWIGFTQE
jgi:hypothetical protein